MEFEWDPAKAESNLRKHRVSFSEASTVFGDPLAATFPDPDHSAGESHYVTIGVTDRGCLIVVAHVERGRRIRVVSARPVTRREREFYEQS
jgi:uncharacterized DUF497 family protein